MVMGLEASDSWSSTGDPKSHPNRGQLLAPSRQTEVTVPAASTTPTLGTIFPAYLLGSGHWFQAVFLWPSSEGRQWAKSLKQNNSALLLHLSALTCLSTESYWGNKLLILTANSSIPASSGTQMSVWSIRGLGSLSKLHTSTLLTSTKTEHYGYSHQFTLCTTNREGRPSFSIQTGAEQQRLQESCLPVHKFKFYCNTYLNIYLCILRRGRDMKWRSREDKFKKQSNISASKKLVAQITSLASDLPFQA